MPLVIPPAYHAPSAFAAGATQFGFGVFFMTDGSDIMNRGSNGSQVTVSGSKSQAVTTLFVS